MRLLEVQQMSCQRRKKAGQKSGQHIPEEVLHGDTLLSEDGPGEKLGYSWQLLKTSFSAREDFSPFASPF